MIDLTEQQFLRAVFCLSRTTEQLTIETVAKTAGLSATAAAFASIRLGHAGLVDTNRIRLTMRGLVAAAQLEQAAHLERRERIRIRTWLRTRTGAGRLFDEAVFVS